MYLTPKNNSYYFLDIETDDLKASTIWCVVIKPLNGGPLQTFTEKDKFLDFLKENPETIFVGHNALSFDIPVLNRLWNCAIDPISRCVDTLVLSFNYRPAMEGGHSLEAWGKRLKLEKLEYNDWSKLSDELILYCQRDVEVLEQLYLALTKRMKKYGYSEQSCEIEHRIREILNKQEETGFFFARFRAENFRSHLRQRQSDLAVQIQRLFPPRLEAVAEYPLRRLKNGSPVAQYEKHRTKFPRVELAPDESTYTCYDYVEFNLGSPKQRVERLLELGWVPTKFTPVKTDKYPEGFPKVDEDALVRFQEELEEKSPDRAKVVGALADWLVLQGRASMLDTWFNNLGVDSRIHGKVITCGASTRRMTHHSPNTANIPSGAKAKYGHECRSFWSVEPDKGLVLVGYDAAGLETAGLCHYLNNPKATEILLRPKPNDIHTANAARLTEALNRPVDREWGAKTSWYAWLYGAYPPKLGQIVKGPPSDGDKIIDTFFRNVPGLKQLIEEVQREYRNNNGRLVTIDGGIVWCPSLGSCLNYKIQSAGAIVMKLTSILLDREAKKLGIPFKRVGDIHDEGQLQCSKSVAVQLGDLAVSSITAAGIRLGFRVALSGDYKIGDTWAETH